MITNGIDFYARYRHEVSWGDIYGEVSGTYILDLKQGGTTGVADVNGVDPNNKFKLYSTLGTHVGKFQAQVAWLHNSGFAETPTAVNLQQNHVSGFNLFNLFFQYKFQGSNPITKNLALTLGIDNVFDTDPPVYNGLSNSLFGVANGFTLGRVFKFGLSEKF